MRTRAKKNADEEIKEKITVDFQAKISSNGMFLLTSSKEKTRRMKIMFEPLEETFD